MKKLIFVLILSMLLALVVLPAVVVWHGKQEKIKVETIRGPNIQMFNVTTKKVQTLPLEKYLVGVLAAEMPASFEPEALKAQAVAARTYAVKKVELSKQSINEKHPTAQVCTDPTHCQAWLSEKEMKKKWGVVKYTLYSQKIAQAVRLTQGIVAVYQGRLIDPVYHSTGVGQTENSGDIWQVDVPYLKSVSSPGDKNSPKYKTSLTLTLHQIDKALGSNLQAVPAATINQGRSKGLKVIARTGTGRIKTISVGGKIFKGEEFRRLLGLNSAKFTWQARGDQITFHVTGYGHGVGMSQYGANGLAKQGKNYKQILQHYYKGIELRKISE
ncbi:stage II sporulation protein D [Bacillota bacterium LX-D]|nr:stage II sporulation protein D [Bacillota bacterium LX-D]